MSKLTDSDIKLFYAAKYGDLQTAISLVTTGKANLYARDIDGRTPIMVAASEGKQQFIQYFAYFGADLSGIDIRGVTSERAAEISGYLDLSDTIANYVTDSIIR